MVKHAETGCAHVALTTSDGSSVCLVVSDEGAGFVPADPKVDKAIASGFGLFSIRERLELLGGRLQVDAVPGHGTRVSIVAPSRSGGGSPGQRRHGNSPAASATFSSRSSS